MSSRNVTTVFLGAAMIAALWFIVVRNAPKEATQQLPQFPSYFMQPSFVNDAFSAIGSVSARPGVSMVLVNHHLLASNAIARIFATVATDEGISVVLIAPDHFAGGSAPMTSVIADWPTPFGVLESATDAISSLAVDGVVHLQEKPFSREHGITNITMFLKKMMPQAKLIPIIVRDDASMREIDALAQAIERLPGRVLVIGSFDFTHDSTDAVARANDARSLDILKRGSMESVGDIIIDSKPGIRLMMRIAQLRNLHFSVLDMTNSAQILRQPNRTDVTSYITGIWAP